MVHHSFKKFGSMLALVGLLMFSGAIVFQIGVAFGWTNPLGNPPTGMGAIGSPAPNTITILSPAASTTAQVTINGNFSPNGVISVMDSIISDLNAPIGGKDAVNKGFVLAQTGGVTTGAGSVVLYYRTQQVGTGPLTIIGGSLPQCPSGWTYQQTSWYGPHYIGVISYGWLFDGTGGSGGGFGNNNIYDPNAAVGSVRQGPPPPPPPPGLNVTEPVGASYSYTTDAIAFGSDSVCSQSQRSVVPVNQFYQNQFTANGATWYADACSAVTNTQTGVTTTECNMCVVCAKP